MSNTRIQEQHIDLAVMAPAAVVEVTLTRPRTTPPFGGTDFEGEKVNHLTEQEVGREEGMGGVVGISFNDTATGTFIAADVFLERLYRKRDVDKFREAEALFPSGADPIDTEKDILPDLPGTTLVGRALNDTGLQAFLAKISINADESIVAKFRNDNAGAVTGEVVSDYDLGMHEQNLGTEAL